MASIRPEILAFVRAAQALLASEDADGSLPLSDDETDEMVEILVRLDKLLQDGVVSPDGELLRAEGDGYP